MAITNKKLKLIISYTYTIQNLDASKFHLTTNTVKTLSIVSEGPRETEGERNNNNKNMNNNK
jgi:hypothetical protein